MSDRAAVSPVPLQQENHSLVKAAGVIGVATFTSRILGFIRDMVLARLFGATPAADAFYVAFRILDEEGYLKWADDAASAMLKHIPRSPYACRGQTHTLFTGDLLDAAGHAKLSNPQRIDPNQNAEIALAFSLLYHDRASGHFHNPAAREIAAEELLASMSLQDMTTGEIPLTGNLPGADTAYVEYAAC